MLNKKLAKFLPLVLASVIGLSVTAGCKNGKDNSDSTVYTPDSIAQAVPANGKHLDNSTSASGYLIKNKASEYTIVVAEDASTDLRQTVAEMTEIIYDVTGVQIPVKTDAEVSYSQSGKFISVGKNSLTQSENITLGEKFKADGYRLITKGNTVFLVGGGDSGAQYACDDFLYRTLGVDWVHPEYYSYDTEITDVPLVNYDVTEIPDFNRRRAAAYRKSDYYLRHWRQAAYVDELVVQGTWQSYVHNASLWLSQDDSTSDDDIHQHDEWNANNKHVSEIPEENSVCFNANGDTESREHMLRVAFDKVKDAMVRGLEGKFIPLSIEDNFRFCECETCTAMTNEYGSYSANGMTFLNDLAKKTNEWFETAEGAQYKREIYFIWLVYTSTWDCPDPDKFTGLEDNVTVWIAPINMDYTKSIYDSENEFYRTNIDQWTKLIGDAPILTWFYNTNFNYYMTQYDDFYTMQDLFRYMSDKNVYDIWAQGQGVSTEFSGFYTFKLYLTAKLEWNVNEDVNELKERWFKGYFGEASETMLQWFENMEAWWATARNFTTTPLGGYRSLYQTMTTDVFYPRNLLDGLLAYAGQAFEDIEPLKATDAQTYELYYDRICRERLSPIFFMLEVHGASLSDVELQNYRKIFYDDSTRTLVELYQEHNGYIRDYMADWGL